MGSCPPDTSPPFILSLHGGDVLVVEQVLARFNLLPGVEQQHRRGRPERMGRIALPNHRRALLFVPTGDGFFCGTPASIIRLCWT